MVQFSRTKRCNNEAAGSRPRGRLRHQAVALAILPLAALASAMTWITTSSPTAAVAAPLPWHSPRCAGRVAPAHSGPLLVGHNCRTVTVGGLERQYIVHVPTNVVPTDPHPVVIVFHGTGGSGGEFADRASTGWEQLGDARQFITVYPTATAVCMDIVQQCAPSGLQNRWFSDFHPFFINANRPPGFPAQAAYPVDDVAFVDAIVADLLNVKSSGLAVQASRLFVAGFSAGGCMTTTLAFKRSTTFAAAASVAGCGAEEAVNPPSRYIPISLSVGTDDPVAIVGTGMTGSLPMRPSAILASQYGVKVLAPLVTRSGLDVLRNMEFAYPRVIDGSTPLLDTQITWMGFAQPLPGVQSTRVLEFTMVKGGVHNYSPLPNVTPAQLAWDFFMRRTM